jgi:hypothetical protein
MTARWTTALGAMLAFAPTVHAQKAPDAGYVFPAGGKAGTTIDVRLGGYDWTPDMEFFVHDSRVQLVATGPPGPILIPPPPYWFGAKGRLPALALPREVPARIVIPANMPAGPVYWQAANANGVTSAGVFVIGTGTEVVEDERRKGAQTLAKLPVTVSGRLSKNEEVDTYRITAPRAGPVTCALMARRLGAKFLGVMAVRDSQGHLVADVAGTNGMDPSLTFAAKAGAEYIVSIHDVDFGGDRSYVYRLTITDGPQVIGALPAAGRRGETREVEFVGVGVATGASKLESVKGTVSFPTTGDSFDYRLETSFGAAPPVPMQLSDLPEIVSRGGPMRLAGPTGVTAVLNRPDAEDRYLLDARKGEVWSLRVEARKIGSPLDVAVTVLGPDGKEVARNDDLPETTDAGLVFAAPADGTYQLVVSDMAGKSGSPAAIYRLVVQRPAAGFTLTLAAQRVGVPIGGKFDLTVKAVRAGGFKGPITLSVNGPPAGITAPANLVIPADKGDLAISLQAAKDASAAAGLVSVSGSATIDGKAVSHVALAPITVNRAPRSPEDNRLPAALVAGTLKPLFKGRPFDQDTGRKVPRGSTFPAEVVIERLDGFRGEIVLHMAATQSYQVQGIAGGDVVVPPDAKLVLYPCYMPEWLETTRTSRLGMVGVAKVADARGKVRYQLNEITGFVTMTMEGALLKVSSDDHDLAVRAGQPFDVHIKVARLAKLPEPVRLELRVPDELAGMLKAEPLIVPVSKEEVMMRVTPSAKLVGPCTFAIRGTAMQDGKYPAISETEITVEFSPHVP